MLMDCEGDVSGTREEKGKEQARPGWVARPDVKRVPLFNLVFPEFDVDLWEQK
jgi:hypothetical protein